MLQMINSPNGMKVSQSQVTQSEVPCENLHEKTPLIR